VSTSRIESRVRLRKRVGTPEKVGDVEVVVVASARPREEERPTITESKRGRPNAGDAQLSREATSRGVGTL